MDGHKTRRNINVLVIGGSGSGKTRTYAKPNIMQCNTSFIVTDPKGELLRDTGHLLKAKGYEIKVFDLVNQEHSFSYNPFVYLRNDTDTLKFVSNIIKNTTDKKATPGEDFWPKAEAMLFEALALYLFHEAPIEEQNFGMLMDMLGCVEVREEDENYISIIDTLFEMLEEKEPDHPALKSYRGFKQAAGKTAKSILVGIQARMKHFNVGQLRQLTEVDELDLHSLGYKKTALFCILPDDDTTFNYLVGLLYTQAFQTLYDVARKNAAANVDALKFLFGSTANH